MKRRSVILCVSAPKLYKFSFCRFHCHACNIGKSRCGNILAPLPSKQLSTFDLKGCCIISLAIQMYHFKRWIKLKKFWEADDNLLMINLAKNTSWRYCCALTKKQVPDLSIEQVNLWYVGICWGSPFSLSLQLEILYHCSNCFDLLAAEIQQLKRESPKQSKKEPWAEKWSYGYPYGLLKRKLHNTLYLQAKNGA